MQLQVDSGDVVPSFAVVRLLLRTPREGLQQQVVPVSPVKHPDLQSAMRLHMMRNDAVLTEVPVSSQVNM